tara:strand:+ start:20716 stop:20841 length:126 start_codon:yes stop_codon:yes gene_type:complete
MFMMRAASARLTLHARWVPVLPEKTAEKNVFKKVILPVSNK